MHLTKSQQTLIAFIAAQFKNAYGTSLKLEPGYKCVYLTAYMEPTKVHGWENNVLAIYSYRIMSLRIGQRGAVSVNYDSQRKKGDKVHHWRVELSCFAEQAERIGKTLNDGELRRAAEAEHATR